jgi:hypothetical protein
MAKTSQKSGVLVPRKRVNVTLPAGVLGWSDLIKPKSFNDEEAGTYSANIHLRDGQDWDIFKGPLQKALDKAADIFKKEFPENKKELSTDAGEFFDSKVKEANEKETLGDYFRVTLKHKEGVSKRTGLPYKIAPKFWAVAGDLLEGKALKLGRDSIVAPVVSVAFYTSPLLKTVEPSLRLEGLVVLKRVSFSGSGAYDPGSVPNLSEEELDQDLARFAEGMFDSEPEDDHDDDGAAHDPF